MAIKSKLIKEIESDICDVCLSAPCAAVKINKTIKANRRKNLIPLCKPCKNTLNKIGWYRFSERHLSVFCRLINNGWYFKGTELTKD